MTEQEKKAYLTVIKMLKLEIKELKKENKIYQRTLNKIRVLSEEVGLR